MKNMYNTETYISYDQMIHNTNIYSLANINGEDISYAHSIDTMY